MDKTKNAIVIATNIKSCMFTSALSLLGTLELYENGHVEPIFYAP